MVRNIEAVTNFIFISDELFNADLMIVPGTFRDEIVKKAMEVYQKGLVKNIITTGGVTNDKGEIESEVQKQFLIDNGVPESIIFNETKSTNTKENAVYTKEELDKHGIKYDKIILVSKAYHSRRILMTFLPSFPNSEFMIAPAIDDRNVTKENWYKDKEKADMVMGEVEKIGKYFLKGDLSL